MVSRMRTPVTFPITSKGAHPLGHAEGLQKRSAVWRVVDHRRRLALSRCN
jgi:hypothetical protein